jgi:MarR family transcriptional regulator, organic hydroperoxide resistance regulator
MSTRRTTRVNHPKLLTIGRSDLLVDGSDAQVRDTIHMLIGYGVILEKLAEGFGFITGITGVQHQILAAVQRLQAADGISVVDLARYVRRSGAFITIEVGKLIKLGLLEKSADPLDRRRVSLKVTPLGHRRLVDLAPAQRRVNDVLFAGVDAKTFRELSSLLERLLPYAERAQDTLDLIVKDARRAAVA